MSDLTKTQSELLRCIAVHWRTHKHAPSRRELQGMMGFRSINAVQEQLVRLRSLGHVDWTDGLARTLHLLRVEPGEKNRAGGYECTI